MGIGKQKSGQPVMNQVMVRDSGYLLIDNVRFNGSPAIRNTAPFDMSAWAGAWVKIDINSNNTPTDIRFLPQVSLNGAWCDFEEGLWASLYWEDQDTADGVTKSFNLPVGGVDALRFVVTATGVDSDDYFDVSLWVRPYLPAVGMAHA